VSPAIVVSAYVVWRINQRKRHPHPSAILRLGEE
jgi:hypothetical protein